MCAGRWWLKDGSPHELLLRVRIRKETGGPQRDAQCQRVRMETVRIKPGTVHAGYVHAGLQRACFSDCSLFGEKRAGTHMRVACDSLVSRL